MVSTDLARKRVRSYNPLGFCEAEACQGCQEAAQGGQEAAQGGQEEAAGQAAGQF